MKPNTRKVIRWVAGVFLALSGLGSIVSGAFLSGVLILLVAAIVLPSFSIGANFRFNLPMSTWSRWIAGIGLLVVFAATMKEPTKATTQLTLDQKIEAILKKESCTNPSVKWDTLSRDSGHVRVILDYGAGDNLTSSLVRAGIFIHGMNVIRALSTNPEFGHIRVYFLQPKLPLVDKFGNESMSQVATFDVSQELARKIKWDNMDYQMFERVVESEGNLWLHPVLMNK